MKRYVPSFVLGFGDRAAETDNDETEGNPDRWASLWGIYEVST